ncbi:MAG: flagellar hook assembly protein FlgD [Pseudomonadota bacterium]
MSISSVGNEPVPQPQTETDRAQLNETIDNFLLMLTTQLQNQDPLSPMDNTEFTNQLIGFSTVEQLINQNEKMDQFLESQSNSEINALIGYVGLDVEAPGSTFDYVEGTAEMSYDVPNQATSSEISILDEFGRVVWRATGSSLSGKHDFQWDGQTLSGQPAEPGTYRISVAALDAEGERIDAQTYTTGRVTGLETTDRGVQLRIGDQLVSAADVIGVRETKSALEDALGI